MRILGIFCLLLALGGCSSLLFYPEPGQLFTPEKAKLEYREVTLITADGLKLNAWWLPAKKGVEVKGTVLHLHGNGGNLPMHLGGSWWLPKEGYQVLLVDYRGYGLSEGEPSLPAIYQDIDAAFKWLDQAPEVKGKPLVLLGQSLGGSMAVHYLVQHPERQKQLKAFVLDGVPASYRSVGRYALSNSWVFWAFQVPLSWLVGARWRQRDQLHGAAQRRAETDLSQHRRSDRASFQRHPTVSSCAAAESAATDPWRPRADIRRPGLAQGHAAFS
jgi:pimeloyl-ACP methyl ester carboxylesterase